MNIKEIIADSHLALRLEKQAIALDKDNPNTYKNNLASYLLPMKI
ncbi:hypothetical protein CLHUN_40940 [Ruminiclostridium hungatei]|uniref:Uncharacterized protein n=1 Tax=Ruminiclostridium hungatei TaxID=48256 RepID=A0A1V4SEY7_RUMHU|nr:hypothetical protein [Ruminiclostridium hungatei]OPX42035.1 hypothetical protein CLHUN_40940 [Ruminiclostridium hungatei]